MKNPEDWIKTASGTKIRKILISTKPILWLTGQTGAGKTTLANAIQRKIGGIMLDGDEMRQSISMDLGFTKNDRDEHNLRVARLAKILSKRNIVIVSVIAPFKATRKKIDKIAEPIWIYVKKGFKPTNDKPYEIPTNFHIMVDSDKQTTSKQVNVIFKTLGEEKVFARNHTV